MWGLLFESFAEAFGVTRRTRPLVLLIVIGVAGGLTALTFAEGGPRGFLALLAIFLLVLASAHHVLAARRSLWRAARWALEDPEQPPRPGWNDHDLAPSASALYRLAQAVNQARRGQFLDASHTLGAVHRDKLRPDEERLFDATRAMVSLGLGDPRRAAQQAVSALPTTSQEIDSHLGRTVIADAWSHPDKLRAIDEEWAARGVEAGMDQPLSRLRTMVKLRIDTAAIATLAPAHAHELADEARAIGDEDLAMDLDSRARPTAYR
jgi:hypothetical protein